MLMTDELAKVMTDRMMDIIGEGEACEHAESQWLEAAVKATGDDRAKCLAQATKALRLRNRYNMRSERIYRRLQAYKATGR
jgi:hypothetical protein